MKTAYVFLAEGFEEIEAVAPIDILRRGDVAVRTVGLSGRDVCGAHGIKVEADMSAQGFVLPSDADMVVLPGGGGGTQNLAQSELVAQVLKEANSRGIYIAAICAAPTILHKAELLKEKTVTAFPTVQGSLAGANVSGGAVECDGNIITARSAGVAMQFGQKLLEILQGEDAAQKVINSMYP